MGRASATPSARKRLAAISVVVALALTACPTQAATSPGGQSIVGGSTVSAGWPWAVFIVNQHLNASCSGALIAPKTVATATHCVVDGTAPGDLFVTSDHVVDLAHSPFVGVTAIKTMPGYDPSDLTTPDVAKIRLASQPGSTTPVGVINRTQASEVIGSAKVLVGGYGLTGPGGPDDSTLREAVFTNLGSGGPCGSPRLLCAQTGPPATCYGDSGGPLIVRLGTDNVTSSPSPSNGVWRLAGITHAGDVNCSGFSLWASLLEQNHHDFLQPETTITSGPSGNTTQRAPTFGFTSSSPAIFQCRVDGAPFKTCRSPYKTATLGFGNHTFRVRANSDGVWDSTPAARSFKVVRP